MSDFTPELVDDVVSASKTNLGEAAEALSRALDSEIAVEVGEATTLPLEEFPAEPGLVVMMQVGAEAAVAVIPMASGVLPEWVKEPDDSGKSRLATLAQELAMLLLPESLFAEEFQAAYVEDMAKSLISAEVEGGGPMVPLSISSGENSGTMQVVWPAKKPNLLFETDAEVVEEEPQAEEAAAPEPTPKQEPVATQATPNPVAPPASAPCASATFDGLPEYTRSLLKIPVTVRVTLASKKQSIGSILELGPGSIIQFEKSCEEMLELEVGELHVGTGEAVKVGDMFGLRLTSITLPDEQFAAIGSATA